MNNNWQRLLRNHPWTWGLPLTLLVISFAIFIFYQLAYAGRIEALEDRFESEQAELDERIAQREALSTYLDRVRASRGGIRTLYLDHFQTAAERQTAVHAEILRLAVAAGLDPASLSYPFVEVGDFELREMGINFSVDGTYEQLRSFINLIELSEQFLTLREINLNSSQAAVGRGSPQLSISISATTVFITPQLASSAAKARAQDTVAEARDESGASDVDPDAETEEPMAEDTDVAADDSSEDNPAESPDADEEAAE